MKLGFLILAHDSPVNTARLIKLLLESGSAVCLHYDLKGGDAPIREIKERLGHLADHLIIPKRVHVAWGEWSIIQATLNGIEALLGSGQPLDYIHLMSGSDYPIRPITEFREFLHRNAGVDFIESHPIARKQWVKDGLSRERYQYRHFFNFKSHPRLFRWCWRAQAALKMQKKPPNGLAIHMGSQWWTLTSATCQHVLDRGLSRDMVNFFRHSWIPDEMVVQTLAAQTGRKHINRHLTLYQFNDYGVPIVFHNSHAEFLSRQPFFFARKLSPFATKLRDKLDQLVSGQKPVQAFPDEQVGLPSWEYSEFKSLHGKGIPGRRLPGHVSPRKQGELAWSNRRYLVILGRSPFEMEQVARLVRQMPNVVCHGYLFANHEVDFAPGVNSVAGYSRGNTALRDHSRSTFLADVVSSNPDKMTCFLLRLQEGSSFLADTLRWDSNASIIMVDGGVLRAHMEIHQTGLNRSSRRSDSSILMEAAAISAFQRDSENWTRDIQPGWVHHKEQPEKVNAVLGSQVPPDVHVTTASFHKLEILQPDWPAQLIKIALEVGVDVARAAELITDIRSGVDRPNPVDATVAISLIRLGQTARHKQRILAEVLASEKNPYLAIVCRDRSTARELAERLSLSGVFSFPENEPCAVDLFLTEVLQYHVSRRNRPVVFTIAVDDTSLMEAVLLDPDVRFIVITNPILRLNVGDSPFSNARTSRLDTMLEEAWQAFLFRVKQAQGRVAFINHGQDEEANEVTRFVVDSFPAIANESELIRRTLDGTEAIGLRRGHG